MTRIADHEDIAHDWGAFELTRIKGSSWVEHVGYYADEAGLVAIWQLQYLPPARHPDITSLTAVAGGQRHMRTWDRVWARRTLPRLCNRFLADIAQ